METVTEEKRRALEELYQRLEARSASITQERAWWPCRMGCDHCCRHLSDPLPITALEWAVLWEGFQRLPPETQAEIRARVAEWERAGAKRPYTCPFLDPKAGACGSLYNLAVDPRLNHQVEVVAGVREAECARLLTRFFAVRR